MADRVLTRPPLIHNAHFAAGLYQVMSMNMRQG